MSSSSDAGRNTAKHRESRKGVLDPGDKVETKVAMKQDRGTRDEVRRGDKRDGEGTRKAEKKDERRPKREREEPAKRDGYSGRRFREVKERVSPRDARGRDSSRDNRDRALSREVREKDSLTETRGRESSREHKERDSSRERRDWDSSRKWKASDRSWGEDRAKSRGADQDQDRGYGRGRGRGSSGGSRQVKGSDHNGNDRGDARQRWGDRYLAAKDSYSRRQRNSSPSKVVKWQHDMFESVSNGRNGVEEEEDPVAKVEALLAS